MRTGLIAKKIGMTRIFGENGEHIPATILRVQDCHVVRVRTKEKDGYTAVQLGIESAKIKNTSKPVLGAFKKVNIAPKRALIEFRVSQDALLNVGDELSVEHFIKGQCVDISGTSLGKGFAGSMKRHNFKGLCASHGVSVSHRSHGSTGNRQDPGKVFKNKKMAGHMGSVRVTMQSLKVLLVNEDEGLLVIRGSIPGHEGSYVEIRDSVKKVLPKELPFPAALKTKAQESKGAEE